jgi:hypothetical protein
VTFRWKDYRSKERYRQKTMTLSVEEFIRRFGLHVLPHGLHRIRHYGLFANTVRVANLVRARKLLNSATRLRKPYTMLALITVPMSAHPVPHR